MTKIEAIQSAPEYYHQYIQLVSDDDLLFQLEGGGIDLFLDDIERLESIGDYTYAAGKWTVKEIVQHLIDTERVFAYRALRFGRGDLTELPGFDENLYAQNADVTNRKLEDLLEEYQLLRMSSVLLYKHFSSESLYQTGTANGKQISIGAMGFVMIGHAIHHHKIIHERYFNR